MRSCPVSQVAIQGVFIALQLAVLQAVPTIQKGQAPTSNEKNEQFLITCCNCAAAACLHQIEPCT
ncbi:hypothetical protein F2Q70_00034507 [Brassica cretica]|uniref:Secreted protein n=1 Tax=Brassica cretica TaxID=69181 RepID=A0A8S9JVF5_BRACR|nr:hypothetical protein F2Q70_00034507 [Brassica cretica]